MRITGIGSIILLAAALMSLAACGDKPFELESGTSITAFAIVAPPAVGVIAGRAIAVTVPAGTDLRSLVATFSLSPGASVKVGATTQVSGTTANDFTGTVVYAVRAEDGGTASYAVTVTPSADTTAPTAGTAPSFSAVNGNSMTVTWGAASDAITAAADLRYRLVMGAASEDIDTVAEAAAVTGANLAMEWSAGTLSAAVTGLACPGTYWFAALAKDEAGNVALYAPVSQATVDVAPTVPSGTLIAASGLFQTAVTLAWPAATDDVTAQASLKYKLVRAATAAEIDTVAEAEAAADIVQAYTTNDLDKAVTSGLSMNTTYWFAVLAKDLAGNLSLYPPVSVAMPDDASPPVPGTGISFSSTASFSTTVAWGAAADNISFQGVGTGAMSYKIVKAADAASIDTVAEADAVSGADLLMDWSTNQAATTKAITGLSASTTYWFAVLVKDTASPANMAIYAPQSVTTAAAPVTTLDSVALDTPTTMTLSFSAAMADPSANASAFLVKIAGGNNDAVKTAALKAGDSTKILLTLSSAIRSGDVVGFNYGTINDGSGSSLAALSSDIAVTNGSTLVQTGTLACDADAGVNSGSGNTTKNYGVTNPVPVRNGTTIKRAFFKFNLGSSGLSSLSSARLYLYVVGVNNASATSLKIFKAGDATSTTAEAWTEGAANGVATAVTSDLTWTAKPAINSTTAPTDQIGTATATGTAGAWYFFDVTDYVNAELAGDKVVSLAVYDNSSSMSADITIASREDATNKPYISYTTSP